MRDRWRTVDPIPARAFLSHTELTRGRRSISTYGTGPDARAAVLARMEGRK